MLFNILLKKRLKKLTFKKLADILSLEIVSNFIIVICIMIYKKNWYLAVNQLKYTHRFYADKKKSYLIK